MQNSLLCKARLPQALLFFGLTGLAALAALGCESTRKVDGQLGERGRITFWYARSCFFGCLIDQPLLTGTGETIRLGEDGNAPDLTVRSSDEDVLGVGLERQCYCEREKVTGRIAIANDGTCMEPWQLACENSIEVTARAAGDAKVEVLRDGQVIDRVTARVRDAERARFYATLPDEVGEVAGDGFTVAAGGMIALRLELYDEDDVELLAPEGVTWRVSDPEVAKLSAFLIGAGAEVEAGRDVMLETEAPGEARVEIEVPGLTAAIDVEVTE